VTHLGQVIFGIGCGALTVLIRYFGGYPEGVSYAILVMNCCVVLLDRIGRPTKYGASAKRKEAAK
jgi:electron transport complex protein RnfD